MMRRASTIRSPAVGVAIYLPDWACTWLMNELSLLQNAGVSPLPSAA